MDIIIKNLNVGDEKFNRLVTFLAGEHLEWSAHHLAVPHPPALLSDSSAPGQSSGTVLETDPQPQPLRQCSHPDVGTDGGGDYCKTCGERWG